MNEPHSVEPSKQNRMWLATGIAFVLFIDMILVLNRYGYEAVSAVCSVVLALALPGLLADRFGKKLGIMLGALCILAQLGLLYLIGVL